MSPCRLLTQTVHLRDGVVAERGGDAVVAWRLRTTLSREARPGGALTTPQSCRAASSARIASRAFWSVVSLTESAAFVAYEASSDVSALAPWSAEVLASWLASCAATKASVARPNPGVYPTEECAEAVRIAHEALRVPAPSDLSPANGQPHRLHLLRQLAELGRPRPSLTAFSARRRAHGRLKPYAVQPQWPAKPPNTSALPELELCEGNWKTAEEEPEVVQSLLDKEISNNWVVATDLTVAEAQRKWPLGVAIGKLNVVFAENKEPRLVLDSTVCQVNTRCYLPERKP